MKNRTAGIQLTLSVIPLIAGILVALYLHNLQGTPGLLRWMPKYKRIFFLILTAGFIPALFFFVSRIPAHFGHDIIAAAAFAFSCLLSILVTVAYAYGTMHFYGQIHKNPEGIPALHRYDPRVDKPLVRLAFSSDAHIGHPEANRAATERILETVNTGSYDAFFILGDIGEMGYPGNDLECAARLFSQKLTDVPIVTLMGNHDSLAGGEYRYRKIFNPDLYFRIDSGKVHAIALNIPWDAGDFDKDQRSWLEKNLASIPASDTTIVITHAFIRASGYREPTSKMDWFDNPELIRELAPILERGGVDLVVSGHNHFMEYLESPEAPGSGAQTAYAIVGSMGGKSDPERTYVSDCSKWYCTGEPGFLDVDLYDGHMKLTFRDESGKPLHEVIH